jgi:creatinine amidohydrolase
MNLNPSTLFLVLKDLVASLEQSGVFKLLLLNSHGGNDLKPMLRELHGQTRVQIFLCNWYQMVGDEYGKIFENKDDHAGEMETSFIMAFRPDLIGRNPDGSLLADEGTTSRSRFEAMNRGWVSITRPWHLLTTNTGSGNPHAATPEKGQRLMALIVSRLSQFLVDLSSSRIDDRFPFEP